jgi:hypothetical protein
MDKKRETLQAQISDWAVFIVGWGLLGWQIFKYIDHAFEGANWGVEIPIFLAAVLFIWKPQTLVDLVSKAAKKKSENL